MYKTVLVPLDGSKRAEAILPHVENLARRYDAAVIFLRAVEQVPRYVEPLGSYTLLQHEMELETSEAESYVARLQEEFSKKGIAVRTRVVWGSPVEAILSVAESEGADIVAMASHGRTGLSRVFYGSVAAGVLHHADRPLLLIRSGEAG